MENKMIGVVGGIGNYAGIDLVRKIYDLTDAPTDQEHLPISLVSVPHKVVDRSRYLMGEIDTNPGIAISKIIDTLISNGSSVIGIPCNTAHAKAIFDAAKANVPKSCKLLNLIEEVGLHLSTQHPGIKKVGLIATTGTLSAKVYPDLLVKYGIEVITPSDEIQNKLVHPSIYDTSFGIKAFSNPVKQRAKEALNKAAVYLSRSGAEAIILGCTEIPLAIQEKKIENSIVIDATNVLAAALIRESIG